MDKASTGDGSIARSVVTAHAVLLLHFVLIAALLLVVIFSRGLISFLPWVVLGGVLVLGLSAGFLWRRLRRQGRSLAQTLRDPVFHGKSLEISLLGGLASLRLDSAGGGSPALPGAHAPPAGRLEDPCAESMRQLQDLARLYERELISRAEFERAKQKLLL